MNRTDLVKIFQNIVSESVKLKNKYTENVNMKVEFADIFAQESRDYQEMTKILHEMGEVIYSTSTGDIWKLIEPIETEAGALSFVKIRIPDGKFPHRGDADFDTDYVNFKNKYQNNSQFELIERDKFEMLRLSDPEFDVMTCFSNTPVRIWIQK